MKIDKRLLLIGFSLIMLLLVVLTVVLIYVRRGDDPQLTTLTPPPGSVLPASTFANTPTATRNVDFIPLVQKPATATPTPTQTASPTPTITPTSTPLRLSFCDQSPGPIPILDYATITDTLSVDFSGVLLDVDLEVDIQHQYSGDLELKLAVIDGPEIAVFTRPGSPPLYCSQSDIRAVFDDEASASANQTCNPAPALSGTLRPEQPLYIFDGLPANLRWQLTVTDRSTPDEGFLNRWCILATIQ